MRESKEERVSSSSLLLDTLSACCKAFEESLIVDINHPQDEMKPSSSAVVSAANEGDAARLPLRAYEQQAKRVEYLQRALNVHQRMKSCQQELEACLSDEPAAFQPIIGHMLSLLSSCSCSDASSASSEEIDATDLPKSLQQMLITMLLDVTERLSAAWNRWCDPRADKLSPLYKDAMQTWRRVTMTGDEAGSVLLANSEAAQQDISQLRYPHFILQLLHSVVFSLTRLSINDGWKAARNVFGSYAKHLGALIGEGIAAISSQAKNDLAPLSSQVAALSTFEDNLNAISSLYQNAWIVTSLLYPTGNKDSQQLIPHVVSSTFYVCHWHEMEVKEIASFRVMDQESGKGAGEELKQVAVDSCNKHLLPLLRLFLKKRAPHSPSESFSHAFRLLGLVYNFYGSTLGVYHVHYVSTFPSLTPSFTDACSELVERVTPLLRQQEILNNIAQHVLSTIKDAPENVRKEGIAKLISQGQGQVSEQLLLQLFRWCSLLLCLSPSDRTASDLMVLAMSIASEGGQQGKRASGRFLQEWNSTSETSRSSAVPPNMLDVLAKGLVERYQHKDVLTALLQRGDSRASPKVVQKKKNSQANMLV
ncbi:hypothetical protein QOT17_004348 [Balamuthia mandrillaris]